MAPILKVLVSFIPSLPTASVWPSNIQDSSSQAYLNEAKLQQHYQQLQHQHIIGLKDATLDNKYTRSVKDELSSVSWGEGRLDIFRLEGNNLTHKLYDGYNWNPPGLKMETLGNGLATPPVAITWGKDRLDIFGLDDHNVVKHQYWDGSSWQPNADQFENLGGACDPQYKISATTWAKNRLDVFCVGPDGDLLHQYYDGSRWQPSAGSLESLGGSLAGDTSAVSWGKNRLDIFSVDQSGQVAHLYWDGYQWSAWETIGTSPLLNFKDQGVTATSWGENRLDIWGIDSNLKLWHIYWDGSQWSSWETLDDASDKFLAAGSPSVTSWSPNRLDIVLPHEKGLYFYKFYDANGQSWRPDTLGWYAKGSYEFSSSPSSVSWGKNRLDIFGVSENRLLHQAWTGSSWIPAPDDWEVLAGPE
ncbi:MAG: hypothetical protein Q9190_004696 [Brigantiaea leucoxantha]